MKQTKAEKDTPEKFGGFPFVLSILALLLLAFISLLGLRPLIQLDSAPNWGRCLAGVFIGAWFCLRFIVREVSVFLHETKHMLPSLFVGNIPKGMKIGQSSGHFEYEYTRDRSHLNAMIALAPYWLPLFTAPALLIMELMDLATTFKLLLVGFCYGVDLTHSLRDMHEAQSDFKSITFGHLAAYLYLLAAHILLLTVIAAWISNGRQGILMLAGNSAQILREIALNLAKP